MPHSACCAQAREPISSMAADRTIFFMSILRFMVVFYPNKVPCNVPSHGTLLLGFFRNDQLPACCRVANLMLHSVSVPDVTVPSPFIVSVVFSPLPENE